MRRNHKPKRSIAIKRREATSASPAPVFNACSPFSPPTYKSHHHVRRRGGGRRGKGSKVKEKAELPPHYSSPTCREFYNNTCRLINGGLISLPVLLIYVSEDDALEEEEEEDKHANVGGSYLCLLQIDSMAASWGRRAAQVVAFLALLVLAKAAAAAGGNDTAVRSGDELRKYKRIIRSQLLKINKPAIKTIQSPDGDLIDCVPTQLQPAFDHPILQGSEPVVGDPPERPKGYDTGGGGGIQQIWSSGGEMCPEGTVPIRRTREEDILRASTARSFGRKPPAPAARTQPDSPGGTHEHAVGYAVGEELYGAKASLNVWAPKLSSSSEFSLSQIWVISGSFATDLNTIEAGWQVSPQLYGDSSPRFFTYWTTDAYGETGCYNLLCSGFVQTSNRIAIGAAISPVSAYNGKQFDISLLIWKDPKRGNWWLEFGPGVLVGYWPSYLFNHLAIHATMVQFGGEIFNTHTAGVHTSTQMGSGHDAEQGFKHAAYFRNLQVVDWDNSLIPAANLKVIADHPNCYDIQARSNNVWGNYFYFGGPGRSIRCP